MATRLFSSALFAGVCAGLIAGMLQLWLVTGLLLEGEQYETGEKIHFAGVQVEQTAGHDHTSHSHDAIAAQVVSSGVQFARHAKTLAFDVVAFTGFGLFLVAGFALAANFAHQVTYRQGIIWGLAGFIAVQLAPAAGLFPELPGTQGASVIARQYWWLGTVAATGAGIALIAFGNGAAYVIFGAALIAAPHLVGAPHLPTYSGVAPPELSALFVSRTLFVALISWTVLGGVAGYFWHRSADTPA